MWIDTHCHLTFEKFGEDREKVVARAREAQVSPLILIGAGNGLEGNLQTLEFAKGFDNLYCCIGIHPHDSGKMKQGDIDQLRKWGRDSKVVGIGEAGLDYHYDFAPKESQRRCFEEQIELAEELNLPLMIHTREAWSDTVRALKKVGIPKRKGIFHCFGETLQEAYEAIELGFLISIPGIVTFKKKAEVLQEVVRVIDLNHILIETDAPYLAPVPYRGKRNEPAFVVEVGKKIAEIKGLSVEEVAKKTTANAKRIFGIVDSN